MNKLWDVRFSASLTTKVSPNDLTGIIVNTANIIFDQNWEKEDDVAAEEDEYDHIQSDATGESDHDEPQPEENSSTSILQLMVQVDKDRQMRFTEYVLKVSHAGEKDVHLLQVQVYIRWHK